MLSSCALTPVNPSTLNPFLPIKDIALVLPPLQFINFLNHFFLSYWSFLSACRCFLFLVLQNSLYGSPIFIQLVVAPFLSFAAKYLQIIVVAHCLRCFFPCSLLTLAFIRCSLPPILLILLMSISPVIQFAAFLSLGIGSIQQKWLL